MSDRQMLELILKKVTELHLRISDIDKEIKDIKANQSYHTEMLEIIIKQTSHDFDSQSDIIKLMTKNN